MKRCLILAVIIALVALSGCRIQKRTVNTNTKEQQITEYYGLNISEGAVTIDTSRSEYISVKITEIEYFGPDEIDNSQGGGDTLYNNKVYDGDTQTPGSGTPKVPPNNNIKKIKTTEIVKATNENNITQTTGSVTTETGGVTAVEAQTVEEVTEEPGKDPYRWRYIFGIVVIIAALFLFLRYSKFGFKIRHFLSSY